MEKEILKSIGLTESETKVYLALLKIKDFVSKGKLLEEAKIASSKVYDVLNKLIDKGLVSTITKNNVKHFAAVNPKRLLDYSREKKEKIAEEEKKIKNILPELETMFGSLKEKTIIEMLIGWKGMETTYLTILNNMKRDQIAYILGASEGKDKEKTKKFFLKYSNIAKLKGINVKIIFNENARNYVKAIEKELKIKFNKRFLFKTTPVEIAVANNIVAIIILKESPIITLIHDKETAESFIVYFNELWKIAKK